MINYSSTYRSTQAEIMDDFDLQGAEMKLLLTDLKRVNKWLGGNKVTLQGIQELLKNRSKQEEITIVDFGCGDGEILRMIAKWGKSNGWNFKLIGIDANTHILNEAIKRSEGIKNCIFQKRNVFSEGEVAPEFDIALFTLFLHHFKNEEIVALLGKATKHAKEGVVINDLHRSSWAFGLFTIFSQLLLKTKIARHDGLVSVARGFKKRELKDFCKTIEAEHHIQWKWAFRWQWLIRYTNLEHK